VMRRAWRDVTKVAACVLDEVRGLFDAADVDRGGTLDREELTQVIRVRYRQEGVARSEIKVSEELSAAMAAYDEDGNGLLDFVEFTTMFAGDGFKWKLEPKVNAELLIPSHLA